MVIGCALLEASETRDNSMLKCCLTLSSIIFFFINLFRQNHCIHAMNIGAAQIRETLLKFFGGKSALLYLC